MSFFAEEMPRVFFDSNTGTTSEGFILNFPQSLIDLSAISDLKDGVTVVLYMPEELEVRATLKYSEELFSWVGVPNSKFVIL